MRRDSASAVVCGAGIAGIAAAYHLSRHADLDRVVLVDREPPLSLTSDKSTECYRNWWPGPGTAMVDLTNRSIELLEELARGQGNRFNMNRRGYLFATALDSRIDVFRAEAEAAAQRGIGPLREHGVGQSSMASPYRPAAGLAFDDAIDGCDLITDTGLIREQFPCLSPETIAVLHVRRCGWLSAQQLGAQLLELSRAGGVRLLRANLTEAVVEGGGLTGVVVAAEDGRIHIDTPVLVNAAGPFFKDLGELVGVPLPVHSEPHVKMSFDDTAGVVDRHAPLIIWSDPTELRWSGEERELLAADEEGRALLEPFPAGVHGRPDGTGRSVLLYWPYHCEPSEPAFPVPYDPAYPQIVLRGMAAMVPELKAYFDRAPNLYVDGGYYTKTVENRPLIGPAGVPGVFNMGAFSGFGIMTAMGAGELLAKHVRGAALPSFAPAFSVERYDDPAYRALLEQWPGSGQL